VTDLALILQFDERAAERMPSDGAAPLGIERADAEQADLASPH
jgi:hypothetical protein